MLKRILIADDQMATREAMAKHATIRGYDVVTVTNGEELLDIASEENFDLIITDIIMPGLNGAVATESMKLQGCTTPIIALTGLSPHDVSLVKTEFNKIYHKPININELFEYVDSLLTKQI
jgi:DNA-binding response OmpR family regulator